MCCGVGVEPFRIKVDLIWFLILFENKPEKWTREVGTNFTQATLKLKLKFALVIPPKLIPRIFLAVLRN